MPQPPNQLFQFEGDFQEAMQCLPMAVRFKLDQCGIKISLKEWSKLGDEDRRALLASPASSTDERWQYSARTRDLIQARTGEVPAALEIPANPPWNNAQEVPADVADKAREENVPLGPEKWAALTPLQRFALIKLSRPRHKNDNFVPACTEFGLCGARQP
jgi:hypothetical protein